MNKYLYEDVKYYIGQFGLTILMGLCVVLMLCGVALIGLGITELVMLIVGAK